MSKGNRNKQIRKDKANLKANLKALMKIVESSGFDKEEKRKITLTKLFQRNKVKRICRNSYGFNLSKQTKMFKRVMYDTYAEGIILNNLAEFHLMGITKCSIRDNDWRNFLTSNGDIK